MNIEKKIRKICEDRDISIAKLARDAGIPKTTIYSMMEREGSARLDNIQKICNATGITIEDFIDDKRDERVTRIIRKIEKLNEQDREKMIIIINGAIEAIMSK